MDTKVQNPALVSCQGLRNEKIMNLFSRQAIPMVWDYGEANILAEVVGGFPTQGL